MKVKKLKFKQFDKYTKLENSKLSIQINQLRAYSIEDYDLQFNGVSGYESEFNLNILNRNIVEIIPTIALYQGSEFSMTIYYHGIRDYSEIFCKISDIELKDRLGQFYQESEICFKNNAWLSFSLMCGAIFEGVLEYKDIKGTFIDKINKAKTLNIITEEESKVMNKVRTSRNLVHANKKGQDYLSRRDGMDIKTTLDKLIDKFFLEPDLDIQLEIKSIPIGET